MQMHTQIWALAQQHGFYKVLVAGRLTDDVCVVCTVLACSVDGGEGGVEVAAGETAFDSDEHYVALKVNY